MALLDSLKTKFWKEKQRKWAGRVSSEARPRWNLAQTAQVPCGEDLQQKTYTLHTISSSRLPGLLRAGFLLLFPTQHASTASTTQLSGEREGEEGKNNRTTKQKARRCSPVCD
jgi:hypothetical protein